MSVSATNTGGGKAPITRDQLAQMHGGPQLIADLINEGVTAEKCAAKDAKNKPASLADLKGLGFGDSEIVDALQNGLTIGDAEKKAAEKTRKTIDALTSQNDALKKQVDELTKAVNDRKAVVDSLKSAGVTPGRDGPLAELSAGGGSDGGDEAGGAAEDRHPYLRAIDQAMKDRKMTRQAATAHVVNTAPELQKQYLSDMAAGRGNRRRSPVG